MILPYGGGKERGKDQRDDQGLLRNVLVKVDSVCRCPPKVFSSCMFTVLRLLPYREYSDPDWLNLDPCSAVYN